MARSRSAAALVIAAGVVAMASGPVLAHSGPPAQPGSLASSWSLDPAVIVVLCLAGWAYLAGLRLLWSRAGQGQVVRVWQAECFAAALAVVTVALVSPLDAAASALFAAHMVQHLLLILVAAPLVVLSSPVTPMIWALPLRLRRRAGRLLHGRVAGRTWTVLTLPLPAWLLASAVLWTWHLPSLYDAALRYQWIHALEHLLLFGSALLFWQSVATGLRHQKAGQALACLFVMAVEGTALGIALTFARSPWYTSHISSAPSWGLTPTVDQQIAGLIMWIPASAVYLGAALTLLATLMAGEEERRRLPAIGTFRASGDGGS